MTFDLAFIGGGVGGSIGFINFLNKINKKKFYTSKNIAIIDKTLENIPGGIPYSENLSSNGFFNNPCRLSPEPFVKWTIKNNNKLILLKYLKKQKNHSIKNWLKLNQEKFLKSKNFKEIGEIYYPRIFLNFWLKKLYIDAIRKKKKNIKLFFLKGEVLKIEKKNKKMNIIPTKKFYNYKLDISKFKFTKNFFNYDNLLQSKKIFISLGLPSPDNRFADKVNDKYFIQDLYEEGGSLKLTKLINTKLKEKRNITIHFLGAKAGFLECLPELKFLILNKKMPIKIISTSQKAETLNAASFSKNGKNYKLKYFTKKQIKNITSGKDLNKYIIKEFNNAKINNFQIYDAWTKILSNKIMSKVLRNFSTSGIKRYNTFYHNKIRNITRFTYPFTIESKNQLDAYNKIRMIKGKILKVSKQRNIFLTKTLINNKKKKIIKLKSDIIVSVTGPQKFENLIKINELYKSLSDCGKKKVNKYGFIVNKNFQMTLNPNIYIVSFNASGYNNKRETIVKAVINNSTKASNKLSTYF
jgi:uncharacterized NAD(P)/FAD-binding protein YdhS